MVKLYDGGVYLVNGAELVPEAEAEKVRSLTGKEVSKESAQKGTIAYSILEAHNTSGDMENLKVKFDAMASHDITFVGIIQTAKASGMEKFPLPYVLTNCHNSLCAVGGTINEDDHMFGLSAAKKYGGIYVPPHIAVIHQYMREMHAGCGKMILGSDSHTRYGALGTMAIGEGGGELVKQLLCDTYDVKYPGVIAIYLDGKLHVQQGIIAGCAGGNYTNVVEAANLLRGKSCGDGEFSLSVYPSSQPVFINLTKQGYIADLMESGAVIRTAFCGPCFGAGDTPCNNGLSIRHTTRNFPNREGSKPGNAQMSAVALMDARSIAATAANGGVLTSAERYDTWGDVPAYSFDSTVYDRRVYQGYTKATGEDLVYGPNIKDWPQISALTDNILLKVCARIMDSVTTTDGLIPSGETSSYRSNPLGLAEFTLSRRMPEYVGRSKAVDKLEKARVAGEDVLAAEPALAEVSAAIRAIPGQENVEASATEIGSMIYAVKPGDGSAREQAASCQA